MAKIVVKKNGKFEPFNKEKIIIACKGAGATHKVARKIAENIAKPVTDKTSTSKIRAQILKQLRSKNPAWEAEYLKYEKAKKKEPFPSDYSTT